MLKAPLVGAAIVAIFVTTPALARAAGGSPAVTKPRPAESRPPTGFNALVGRPVEEPWGTAPLSGPLPVVRDPAAGADLDLGSASRSPDVAGYPGVGGSAEALPLSSFLGAESHARAASSGSAIADFFHRVRYGGLPEPASWALILIGFGMIGAAIRGFVLANRRLARLQADAADPDVRLDPGA